MTTKTYSSYLQLDALLDLQQPKSDEHDELLFIVIHQVYELWFKQVLHELNRLKGTLVAGDGPAASATLERILTILKTMVAQVDVLETMTPVSFLSFRERLASASGFQSAQFREVEIELGVRRLEMARYHEGAALQRLEARARQPSLWDGFLAFLARAGYAVASATPATESSMPQACAEVQAALVEIYRGDPPTARLCELLISLDEGLQEWRYRHVKMVERTIGTKTGTGGSSGAEYLRSTLFQPVFPDLWAVRQKL